MLPPLRRPDVRRGWTSIHDKLHKLYKKLSMNGVSKIQTERMLFLICDIPREILDPAMCVFLAFRLGIDNGLAVHHDVMSLMTANDRCNVHPSKSLLSYWAIELLSYGAMLGVCVYWGTNAFLEIHFAPTTRNCRSHCGSSHNDLVVRAFDCEPRSSGSVKTLPPIILLSGRSLFRTRGQ